MQVVTSGKHKNALAKVPFLCLGFSSHFSPPDSNRGDASQLPNSSVDKARAGGRAGGSERRKEATVLALKAKKTTTKIIRDRCWVWLTRETKPK